MQKDLEDVKALLMVRPVTNSSFYDQSNVLPQVSTVDECKDLNDWLNDNENYNTAVS